VIYVEKPRTGAPKGFLAAAAAEWKKIQALFARGRPAKPPFAAYRNDELKRALEDLFHRKCAYCETSYAAVSFMQVEHYRPKKIYYWLAADWSNLLPSCQICNNGKSSKFPLADPRRQARKRGEEKRETPLLLNPTDPKLDRRPERHLTFGAADGAIQAVAVRGKPSPLGLTSIQVYRLTRPELAQARRDWAKRVRKAVLFSQEAAKGRLPADLRRAAEDDLFELMQPTQPFRALTVKILRESGIALATPKRRANGR
jgi:uncharacterized protein (TIGR02646 family)